MKKMVLFLFCLMLLGMTNQVEVGMGAELVGTWKADATTGSLGSSNVGSGGLLSAGWSDFTLVLNSDGTYLVSGHNAFGIPPYNPDSTLTITHYGFYTIDESQSPMHIDLLFVWSDNTFFTPYESQPSIFELTDGGASLKIAFGSSQFGIPRPTEFETSGNILAKQPSIQDALIGTWVADSTHGSLGSTTPGSGSLLTSGWSDYRLAINDGGSYLVSGHNAFGIPPYNPDSTLTITHRGIVNVDVSQTPPHIDIFYFLSDNTFFGPYESQPSIYELTDGDQTMKIAFGSSQFGIPRPTDFAASGNLLAKQTPIPLEAVGTWLADSTHGSLGSTVPGSGSLLTSGWSDYRLAVGRSGTYLVGGHNAFGIPPYNPDSTLTITHDGFATVDATQTPAWIDLSFVKSDNTFFTAYESQPSIYEVFNSGALMKIAFGSSQFGIPRPTEFETSGNILEKQISLITAINEGRAINQTPSNYSLVQNYPNPFNPETKIEFSLQKSGRVEISIYNLLGQEIITLVNEVKSPGKYQVKWNGKNRYGTDVSSGIYFYQMKTENFTDMKKMMLIR
ncbi:MAG: T9SS type A sorting domain-containing protein [bacterium]